MAKSNYLSGILFIGALLLCGNAGRFSVNAGNTQFRPESNPVKIPSGDDRSSRIAKVKQIYDSQIGIKESGQNSGPQVEQYLSYVNLSKGNPWCAAFVCWVYGQAGVANPRTGWSPALFPASKLIWSRKSGLSKTALVDPSKPATEYGHSYLDRESGPATGDVFGIYFPEKGRIAHVGFIDTREESWLITVEGNTNPSGAREGDGVYRKRRLIRSIDRVARYIH